DAAIKSRDNKTAQRKPRAGPHQPPQAARLKPCLEIQMQTTVSLWPLIGVAVIIAGFLLRFNPMLIVAVAAIATGLAAQFPPEKILAAIGTGFIKTRNIPLIILLP